MAKPKAPTWLREAFRDGIDYREAETAARDRVIWPVAGPGINVSCYLGHHDEAQRPCSGPRERFHFIGRERIENAFYALLPAEGWSLCAFCEGNGYLPTIAGVVCPNCSGTGSFEFRGRADLILLAAWDSRVGGLGCEHHHRRFDGHACSPQAPKIIVPRISLPPHVEQWGADFGLEHEIDRKFP